jgi:hypothetical protein
VYGSHSARRVPRLILSPSLTNRRAALGELVHRTFVTLLVFDDQRYVAAQRDDTCQMLSVTTLELRSSNDTFVVGLDERFIKNLCRAANVEGTHGELRTWLTDRLSRNNADSLAEVDRGTTGQITAVATGTHTKAGFAGQHRADAEFLDVRFLDLLNVFFSDLSAIAGMITSLVCGCSTSSAAVRPRTRVSRARR